MVERYEEGPFWRVYQDLKAGRITRREFIARATSLGVGLPIVLFVLNAVKVQGAAAQSAPAGRPAVGTENIQRGAGGELKILQWQAATHLSLHNSTGTKDSLAASLITEPLMNYLPDGTLIPNLVTEVPSVENGLLSPDLKTVTYKLRPDVKWSDGEPFTADDVIFTWQWILDPANQSVSLTTYQAIENIEKIDDLTVKLIFKEGSLAWYFPFTGTYVGAVYPKHFWDGKDPQAANDEFRRNAIGTGPYKVESFTENDQVTYVINENYREPNKPFFSRVIIKGGGDAASAAQAVLQTGDWHFAWNLQVAPNILREMEQQGGKGKVIAQGLGAVERVLINFSDPNDESKGERSHKDVPHPFLTDKAVRQALSLASDRATIANQFYLGGDQEPPAVNILTGIAALESPNTSWEFNLDKAKQVLDEAGWVMDGDVRKKGDIELKVTYFTSINPVRQQTQAVNKQNWEAVGFKVTLGRWMPRCSSIAPLATIRTRATSSAIWRCIPIHQPPRFL